MLPSPKTGRLGVVYRKSPQVSRHTKNGHTMANAENSVTTAGVTVIKINPNITGSGVVYSVYGTQGGTGGTMVANGSALNGPVSVSVSGYDEYFVTFGGPVFGNEVPIKSGHDAQVTLAITTSQG